MKAGNWRVESGSLPGLSYGDVVGVEVADDKYTFSKEGVGRIAILPVASTKEDFNPTNGWVEVRDHAQGIQVTLSPAAQTMVSQQAPAQPGLVGAQAEFPAPEDPLLAAAKAFTPRYECTWLSLRYKAGFIGLGGGWDKSAIAEIERLGNEGFTLVSAVGLVQPNVFLLFFQRRVF